MKRLKDISKRYKFVKLQLDSEGIWELRAWDCLDWERRLDKHGDAFSVGTYTNQHSGRGTTPGKAVIDFNKKQSH